MEWSIGLNLGALADWWRGRGTAGGSMEAIMVGVGADGGNFNRMDGGVIGQSI